MLNFQKLSLLWTLLFLVGNPATGKNHVADKCGKVRIEFPFYLRNKNLNHTTDYPPEFGLLCTQQNEPILELPALPIQLFVTEIDYQSMLIRIYDPQNCLNDQLLKLGTTSISPFRFPIDDAKFQVSVFQCDSSCPIFVGGSHIVSTHPQLVSCTKLKDVYVEGWSWYNGGKLDMEWSKPDCGDCEAQGQKCKWKNGTNRATECYASQTKRIPTSTVVRIAAGIGGFMLLLLSVKALFYTYDFYKKRGEDQARIEKFLEDYRAMKPTRFTYADIKRITNGFSESLGEGSHGAVFKGMLSSEIIVAVKILKDTVGDGKDFINEVRAIGKIHHVNIVRLLGFCADEFHRALVYDFFPNGSLQRFLVQRDNKDVFLGWEKLQQIGLGVGKGIEYLHLGCDHRILHFDINPHNVLLDDLFVPKITDFGLAKLCPKNQSTVSMTAARGTLGYIAPEVFSRNFGNVSYKSDIYSYGMLLLEMVGGRKNTNVSVEDSFQILYPEWIHNLVEGKDVQISVEDDADAKIAKKLAIVGLWCIQWNPADRPSMKTVVQMLEGDGCELVAPPSPFHISGSSTTNTIFPARRQNFELEVIHEIEENSVDHF
ncbi:rust resistance kinase Lr10-like isoform X2 [Vigna umbellata]|uniref:rust resistance kinase Lr10-like isoform X1 n=1 Tax=Vigna umbellata TaxID=87088 RepID=UPI001F5F5A87|nr:rust resistance kinase Lr10-like isoform X1 [Vigna umbellata]XP_047179492.1 rust resistance kinase Lr10-like isoform X2 [Vigna umbellata]